MSTIFGRKTQEREAPPHSTPTPEESGELRAIGAEEISKASAVLQKYKEGKSNLEKRVIEEEQWYELRHWEVIRREKAPETPEPTSAWLFNAIMNKHADAMDNFPEPNVLPRERDDEEDAQILSSILPVILEHNDFEDSYSDNWWEKLKHGSSVYGVFWNKELENGLGNIDIHAVDLLNIFWEPGVSDIQKSRNVFVVNLADTDLLEAQYPQYAGKLGGNGKADTAKYLYADAISTENKSVVVDWYYKLRGAGGQTLLHYVKFCGACLLFASENEAQYTERGFYDHGDYPFVFDTLFPEKGSPAGFGYVAIAKSPQLYIDKLDANIMENSLLGSKARYFISESTGVNEEEFTDCSKSLVHVAGQLGEERIKAIEAPRLDGIYVTVQQNKINELKETSANRDVSSGGASAGVTAASAIAALQEAGNKGSRDMISASYRKYTKLSYLCIELIRQFYDEERTFRITGEKAGKYEFVDYSNAHLRDAELPPAYPGAEPYFRRPVFDISIKAQKKNPYSRMAQNETAKELYSMGAFNPERAQETLPMLEMMEFEGIDKLREQVRQGQTLLGVCQQMSQQLDQMAAVIQSLTGENMGIAAEAGKSGGHTGSTKRRSGAMGGGQSQEGAALSAEKSTMTSYGQKLAARAAPDMGAQL